jgi:hypothetical protein
MGSKHRSIAVLGALVVFALAVSASAASATTLYEWKVGGAALKSGAEKEITIKNKSGGLFHFSFSYEAHQIVLTAGEVKFMERPTAKILGGKPGTLKGKLEFTKVTINFPNCEVEEEYDKAKEAVETVLLTGEVVESAEAGKGTGKVELLFKPFEGPQLMVPEWKGNGCLADGAAVDGSVLAEMSPQKGEAKVGKLLFGTAASKNGSEYRNSKGEFKKTELESGGLQWELSGEPEIELVSKEVFGAF